MYCNKRTHESDSVSMAGFDTLNAPLPCHRLPSKSNERRIKSNVHIAEALQQMSLEERDKVFQEVHGVADSMDETPVFVNSKLMELQNQLQSLKMEQPTLSQAFQQAEHLSINSVYDPAWMLRFLRTEQFHTRRAAERMMRYYSLKRQFFGDESLFSNEVSYDELTDEDKANLAEGGIQLLPERDQTGRAVLLSFSFHLRRGHNPASMARTAMFMDAPRDEETQKKGVVLLLYHIGRLEFGAVDPVVLHMGQTLKNALPMRVTAIHHCFADTVHGTMILDILMRVSDKATKGRVKLHNGSRMEVEYALMTYGIPVNCIPLSKDGEEVKLKNHTDWIAQRRVAESMRSQGSNGFIELPSTRDFLIGKGRPLQFHPGNARLHSLIDEFLPKFDVMSKSDKTDTAKRIVEALKADQCRFLSQDQGIWMEVTDEMARSRVAQLFRSRRKLKLLTKTSSNGGIGASKSVNAVGETLTKKTRLR